MGKTVSKLFGMGDAAGKLAEQQHSIEAQNNRMALIENGQRRLRNSGTGFRAFLDENRLKSTLGG